MSCKTTGLGLFRRWRKNARDGGVGWTWTKLGKVIPGVAQQLSRSQLGEYANILPLEHIYKTIFDTQLLSTHLLTGQKKFYQNNRIFFCQGLHSFRWYSALEWLFCSSRKCRVFFPTRVLFKYKAKQWCIFWEVNWTIVNERASINCH